MLLRELKSRGYIVCYRSVISRYGNYKDLTIQLLFIILLIVCFYVLS